jgi:hypothetical protein
VVLEPVSVQYTVASSVFHGWLLYWYAAPVWAAPRLESWVHLAWLLQLFYYTLSLVGHWLPEVERQLTVAVLTMVHGMVWLTALLAATPSFPLPGTLAALDDGRARPFAEAVGGTVTAMLLPVPLFYAHLASKWTLVSLVRADTLDAAARAPSVVPWAWAIAASYQLLSPLVPLGLWHLWLRPPGHAAWTTDWATCEPVGALGVAACALVVNGTLALVLEAWQGRVITPIYWTDYYRRGVALRETHDRPPQLRMLVVD